jgi:uncharacterized Zn finger protein
MNYDRDYYNSGRRRAKGGIKPRSARGAFGKSWWAKRWVAVLERFNQHTRLDRGRSYARSGQVLSITIKPGQVAARVQGSRRTPYSVTIAVKTLSAPQWGAVLDVISTRAVYSAKLLSGEMPADIEEVFRGAHVPLFPEDRRDMTTECSCPDWANPCKHIAAVYYLIGEEFDRDPFLIFKLRGLQRDDLLTQLATRAGTAAPMTDADDKHAHGGDAESSTLPAGAIE